MKWIKRLSVVLPLVLIFSSNQAIGNDLLIQNASLIDGSGNPPRESMSVLIRQGKISKISKHIAVDGIRKLDVNGAFVLPGLIDSHVHLMWGPGALLHHPQFPTKETWRKTWGRYFPHYLKAYLACGVTTILDLGAPPYVINEIRQHLSAGNPGPRYLCAGQFISLPGGYGVIELQSIPGSTKDGIFPLAYEVKNEDDLKKTLDKIQSQHTVGIKMPIEKGWSPFSKLPRHSPEMLQAIKREAAKRNLPLYVHATSEEDMTTAIKLGVHALAHTLTSRGDEILSDRFVADMAKTDTYQMTTLSIMDASLIYYHPDRLNDPLLNLVVPKTELDTARDPNKGREAYVKLLQYQLPWPLKLFSGFMVDGSVLKNRWTVSLKNSKQGIRRLHKAGVPIVMGSDTAYLPFAVYAFHGYTTLREIELLGEAGLSPAEAIKAAIITPARMLGLGQQIGSIEVGKEADLVIVKENPLVNLRALKTIQWTIKGGIAHTPEEWMSQ